MRGVRKGIEKLGYSKGKLCEFAGSQLRSCLSVAMATQPVGPERRERCENSWNFSSGDPSFVMAALH